MSLTNAAGDIAAQLSPELRWQIAVQSAGIAMWDFHLVTGELYLSELWYRMRGLEPRTENHMSEQEWLERIHPDDADLVRELLKRQYSGSIELISDEHRERHEAGHWIWVLSRGRVVLGPDGKPLRYIGTNSDITEIKTATTHFRQLAASEQRWRTALEGAEQGLWDHDRATNEIFLSDQWFTLRGLDPKDKSAAALDSWLKRVHPDDLNNLLTLIKSDHVGASNEFSIEYRERHGDGSYIWVLSKGVVVRRGPDGKSQRKIGTDTDVTAIKNTETRLESLGDTERRWRIAGESAGQGLWDINHATGQNYFSDDWRTMRGIPVDGKEPPTSADWLDTIHPEDRPRIIAEFNRRKEAQSDIIEHEYRQRHADGRWVWILSRGKIVERDNKNNIVRMIGTDTDVSAMKEAENRLRETAYTERRWRTAVESARQAIWDINDATDVRYLSPIWYQMRGLEQGDKAASVFANWIKRIHPGDVGRVLSQTHAENAQLTDAVSIEYRERHAAGHYIWILSRGQIVERGSDGKPTHTIGTDTDITALKQSEEFGRQLAQRHELAISSAKIGVWEFDFKTNKATWDQNTCDIFGVTIPKEEIVAETWESCIHPEDREKTVKIADDAEAAGTGYTMDYRILTPGGEVRHVRCRASYYTDSNAVPKLIGVSWDITADIKNAAELKRAKELAERRAEELDVARRAMEYNSFHDALTGLPNRRHLDSRLQSIIARPGQLNPSRTAIFHVDLDRFKHINDTLGHAAGDLVLHHAAAILREGFGASAMIFRAGGDEFAVVMDNAPNDEQLSTIAKSIVRKMRQPVDYNGHQCLYGASIGIAVCQDGTTEGRQLLINADIALYRAKNEGRNRACFFNLDMQTKIIAQKRMADDILRGLDRGEFYPVYQLQFCARTHDITGVEALCRWRHPERGILNPDQFLPVAEEINAVARIDETILHQALANLSSWRMTGLSIPCISVNVSARRLGDERLIERISKLDIPPKSLSFELLESIYLDNQSGIIAKNLEEIRKMGIGIEIDDFGTGHASIAGILSLRPECFKIDRQLVQPIVVSVEQRRLVASIVDIGRSLNIRVVAEGVETLEHARILRDLDCDCLQGYAFARPMDAAAIADFVGNARWRKAA